MSESEARAWLRFAREDLETAELELEHGRPPRFACFDAQQAGEKAIKAAIIAAGASFPFTHDLEELLEIVPGGWRLRQTSADLPTLSQWAVQPRYPDTAATLTVADAEKAIEDARIVVRAAEEDLDREGV